MKRIIAIVLAVIIVIGCCVFAVPAAELDTTDVSTENKYKDKFMECLGSTREDDLLDYRELYYHTDEKGETDWVLLYAGSNMVMPATFYSIIGNRVFIQDNHYTPFYTGYGIYDVKLDKIINISNPYEFNGVGYEGYDRAIDEYGKREDDGNGRLLGDIDSDDQITVIDVTLIQRCEAQICSWPQDDAIGVSFGDLTRYSDFNRDGACDILDATCIQRYLIGLSYPAFDIEPARSPSVSVSFEDIDHVYDHSKVTAVASGEAPFTYCYTIVGTFHGDSQYGDDLGEYHVSEEYFEPGNMIFTTGYIDSCITTIPTHSITYGESFELTVTVKDASGRESEPVTVTFFNR